MCRICFISNNYKFNHFFIARFQKDLRYEIRGVSDVDLLSKETRLYRPDVFIVDFLSLKQTESELFNALRRINPKGFIIIMMKDDKHLPSENFIFYGVDEVVTCTNDLNQVEQLREKLVNIIVVLDRLVTLQEKIRKEIRLSQIVAKSKSMREIMLRLPNLADSTATVLITGETGTGKELIARALHYLGPRAGQPFVTIDCGAIPENLAENELFGHVRGAYTDAGPSSQGLIKEADGGSLFLDEVESLPLAVQSKFLRFLQERQFKQLGQSRYISVDVRILAATNINLLDKVNQRSFRKDLYYRLNVLPVFLPPLRQRKADIPALISCFQQRHAQNRQNRIEIPEEIIKHWLVRQWPGNVRELENEVQQWLLMQDLEGWKPQPISEPIDTTIIQPLRKAREDALVKCERNYLEQLMIYTRGNISQAARLAQINRKSLGILLKKRGIEAKQFLS